MRSINLLLLLVMVFSIKAFAQEDALNQQIDQLFFYLPLNSNQYEIRKKLHLDENLYNVAEYQDYCKCISADFYSNPILRYIGSERHLVIWFNEETKFTDSRKISFRYYPDELGKADKQLKQLYNIFKNLSLSIAPYQTINARQEISGEGYYFYLSNKSDGQDFPYLSIGYKYIQASNYGGTSYYHFEIILNEEGL
ncbi:MAG: hypothetical protein ISS19_18905 [Bacteroidales bacterium]|nr:hypothetical protein [Bacteroidales bacterium]